MNSMYGHFLNLSISYNELRTTDQEPVLYIGEKLDSKKHIRGPISHMAQDDMICSFCSPQKSRFSLT